MEKDVVTEAQNARNCEPYLKLRSSKEGTLLSTPPQTCPTRFQRQGDLDFKRLSP